MALRINAVNPAVFGTSLAGERRAGRDGPRGV